MPVLPLKRVLHNWEVMEAAVEKGDKMTLYITGGAAPVVTDYAYEVDFLQWPDFGLSEDVSQVTFSACYPTQKVEQDGTFEFNSFNF